MNGKRIGWNEAVTLHPSSSRHKNYRKLLHTVLSKSGVSKFHHLQYETSEELLTDLIHSPLEFRNHVPKMVGETVSRLTYGFSGSSPHGTSPNYIEMAEKAQAHFSVAATPNTYWVDFMPWCKLASLSRGVETSLGKISIVAYVPSWIPFANFQRDASRWREELSHLTVSPFQRVKEEMVSTNTLPAC